ncbi:hypothetical protein [Streptomyces massasporeus]|uniref:hypothetical protein n=1 Tax=Streptomyces massasporeus TaxID=67324 RepID=UPI00167316AE|nr:hypothetical protein [Streptomyces massasporeus]GGV80016.1 hypothetical protein GCM10010228_50910 [Streptomyces massasporeus]
MRDVVGRACMAGLVVGIVVTGLGACTGGEGESKADQGRKTDKPVATACANGTFTWSHLTERERLTGVSDLERLGKGGGPLRNPMRRVYTPSPSVRADGPAPSPAEILFSLGKKAGEIDSDARTLAEAGETWPFTDVRQPAPELDTDRIKPNAAGEYIQYAGVMEVAADFRYRCPDGRTVSGHARNWTVDFAGLTDCEVRPDSPVAREVARRSCERAAASSPSGA